MIALGVWFIEYGFMVLENESPIMLARKICSGPTGRDWAILRLTKNPDGVTSEWELLRTYYTFEKTRRILNELEEGMWAQGLTTEPSCAEQSPYADVEGFGAF